MKLVGSMKMKIKIRMRSSVARFALGSLLLASLTYAQAAPSDTPSSSVVSPPSSDVQPVTPVANDASAEAETLADPASLLPNMPALPRGRATLIGGTIQRLDRVRDQITLGVYGGGKMKILFDPRTHIYSGTAEATTSDLHVGQRVSLDTMLDGTTIFARTIRLKSDASQGETQGVVVNYNAGGGELTIRDAISPKPVKVRMNASTKLMDGGRVVSAGELTADTLVAVKFSSERDGHDVAREISILALPGSHYTFQGQIVNLDLRTGMMVISSATDQKVYEIYLDPASTPDEKLRPGAVVTVETNFEGSRYVARSLSIDSLPK